ncbi:hypothetical protein ABIG05_005167 [Bradyrhizobium japonicum]
MQYLPVAGLPVVGAPDSMNGVAPEGAVVTPTFNAMLGQYAPASYQYLPVASPALVGTAVGSVVPVVVAPAVRYDAGVHDGASSFHHADEPAESECRACCGSGVDA